MSGVKLFVVKIFYRLSFLTVLRIETAIQEHEYNGTMLIKTSRKTKNEMA